MKVALITLVLGTLIIFLSGWLVGEGYLKPAPAQAESSKETHGGKETTVHVDETHAQKDIHRVEDHKGTEAHETEEHGEESWWRFPGWQIVFAAIGCLYFALVLAWLPLLVAKESEGSHH